MPPSQAPFLFDAPFRNRYFTGRDEELQVLVSLLRNGHHAVIAAPPGWGKSWLAAAAMRMLVKDDPAFRCLTADLFAAQEPADFLAHFAGRVLEAASPDPAERLELARRHLPHASPYLDPEATAELRFDRGKLQQHPDEVLNLPEMLATESGERFLIYVPDFQRFAQLERGSHFERRVRAVWQNHRQVSYLFTGSGGPAFVQEFERPSRSFYRFAEVMPLQPLSPESCAAYVSARFKAGGKKISPKIAEKLSSICEGQPRLLQELGFHLWQLTGSKAAGKKELRTALELYFALHGRAFIRMAEGLSITQLNLLKAVAMGEQHLSSLPVMQAYRLGSPASTTKNRRLLMAADFLTGEQSDLRFTDPLFGFWLRMRYFGAGIRELV